MKLDLLLGYCPSVDCKSGRRSGLATDDLHWLRVIAVLLQLPAVLLTLQTSELTKVHPITGHLYWKY